tara:strand:- start:16738 stop:18873 length:2136 start_codon:yes stop_codon:yes gene_type:complete
VDIKSLNSKQQEAVLDVGGPMLVFAGAGSGKTRVLTYKIAHLIESSGLPPEHILAVTFTNKAAQEMKMRIHELVDSNLKGITIGTFHSIGAMILRRQISKIGWTSDFTIYDQTDAKALVKSIIKDLNLDLKMYDPKSTLIKISSSKNSMQSPKEFLSLASNVHEEKIGQIYAQYEKQLKQNNSVDFDDLLVKPLVIFDKYPEILEFYREKFQYVLVDEYQDTNKPQFTFIYQLTKIKQDIFVVGDDDQSIYGWRGADITNILNFKNSYMNAKIVKLEQNYRSTKNILEAAWSVVSKNTNRADKKLWTDNDFGDKIDLIQAYNEKDEAHRIIEHISNIKRKNDVEYSKFLILYRTNAQSRIIEDTLIKNGILYTIIGGVKFYDRKEVKDLLAYMRFIVNPNDQISFDRIINFPARGIGKTTVNKIYDNTDSNNILLSLDNLKNIKIGKKQLLAIENFSILIKSYSERSKKDSPLILIKDLLSELKLKEYYLNQGTQESLDRWANIEECISGISDYENNTSNPTLGGYLEEVSLFTDIDSWNDDSDKVTMMTIHSSKGLEFDYVYIAGLEDGLFPIVRLFEDEDVEEERRLFYVALTRAQIAAVLSYANSRRKFGGEPIPTSQSRFIREIPENLINSSTSIKKSLSFNKQRLDSNIISDCPIKVGQIVMHKIFGKGKVVETEGSAGNTKITIMFFNNTRKKLIYKYANLKIME